MRNVLTTTFCKANKGKRIHIKAYGYAGQDTDTYITIGEVVSAWDMAARETMPDGQNRQEYWASYMMPREIEVEKTKYYLLDEDGNNTWCYTDPYYNYDCPDVLMLGDNNRWVFYEEVEDED